mmetsp:Transcript_39521/g.63224  ORF Transcript_39521/g.63224 Transcript_39521/m.63224 type:complete len:92 (-) Transcript_39521:162-437(-)
MIFTAATTTKIHAYNRLHTIAATKVNIHSCDYRRGKHKKISTAPSKDNNDAENNNNRKEKNKQYVYVHSTFVHIIIITYIYRVFCICSTLL